MKTTLLFILVAFSATNVFAQSDSLSIKNDIEILNGRVSLLENLIDSILTVNSKEMNTLTDELSLLVKKLDTVQVDNSKILTDIESIKSNQSSLTNRYRSLASAFELYKQTTDSGIDSLYQGISLNSDNIEIAAEELGVKIGETQKSADDGITGLSETISQNTLYWIIAILAVSLFVIIVFVLLRKQIFKQKTDLDSNLLETRKVLEEEGVKLDSKLIEVLETQLKIIESSNSTSEKETDHSLALKVADEIIRIQKNLSRMDEKTKGLKQLAASVKRIQDNFASNGYELVEMIGLKFDEGMHVNANFIPSDNLKEGERIITRIIKPQVNFKDVMIQKAQIEVSQG